jgi:hypothetical protein
VAKLRVQQTFKQVRGETACFKPKIKVSIKLAIHAYKSHSPLLKILINKENVKKLTTTTIINPYLLVSTADTGAQVIILGHNHLNKVVLHIYCLHWTETVKSVMSQRNYLNDLNHPQL